MAKDPVQIAFPQSEEMRTSDLLEVLSEPDSLADATIEELSKADLAILVRQLGKVVRHQEARFASITDIGAALGSTFNLDELLTVVMSKITELMQAERSTLFLLDEEYNELWSLVTQGEVNTEIRMRVGEGIAGWVASTGQSINIRDAYSDTRFNPEVDAKTGFQTRSILCQPMRNQAGKTIGVIQVLNRRSGNFKDEDENLLSALSSQAAVAIENSKLYLSVVEKNMELEELAARLETKIAERDQLFEIEHQLSLRPTLNAMIDEVTRRTAEVFEADASVLTLVDGDHLRFFIQSKHDDGFRFKVRDAPWDTGICGQIIRTVRPYICNSGECETVPGAATEELGMVVNRVIAVPLFADDGQRPIGALKVVNRGREFDRSDLKLLSMIGARMAGAVVARRRHEELEMSRRLASIGQMLSGVIHDLKNPIAIINGYVQLMVRTDDREKRDDFAQTIYRQFDQLNQMTQELLNFARGEKNLLMRRVFLPDFFNEVAELLLTELTQRHVELILKLNYAGDMTVDSGKLQRVILNLARNAADAMPGGGTFEICVDQDTDSDEVILSFADSGTGIPKEVHSTLFDEFVTRGKNHGTGLGLAIVKKIVDLHGGTISFDSVPNEGTTFTIRLPRVPPSDLTSETE